jgi:thiamine biosynthesis protein ThiS
MRIRVKLFGTLSQRYPGYQQAEGLEVEIPDGATAKDLLAHLGIPESRGVAVAVDGRILKADERIAGGAVVHVLQVLSGG